MAGLNLKNLKVYRNEILKAEIISLLALWDKIDPAKINKANVQLAKASLDCWKNDIENNEIKILGETINLWDHFLNNWRKWRKRNDKKYFLQVLYGIGESLNSGIDKGAPKDSVKVEPQDGRWLSNSFGSFRSNIIYLLREEKDINSIIGKIEKYIKNLFDTEEIKNWNELKLIKEKFEEKVEKFFCGLLSDDRFPVNDVSLWDQAYMATAMFKASLSEYILKNNCISAIPQQSEVKWRILGVQYDKLGLAEKGYKPQQIQWYREISKEIDDEIKTLLEYEYPIGNEIYRDETGIYFLVGEGLGEDLKDNSNLAKLKNELKGIEDKIIDIFKRKSFEEFYPAIFLTKASRGLMNLSYLIEKAKENFLKADWSKKKIDICLEKSESGRAIGICQICRQRLVFKSDIEEKDKNICSTCYENKTQGRIKKWFENLSGETIWMDELKDKNGRVALVTMKFELRDWLNGDMLNSLVLQKGINFLGDIKSLKKDLTDIYIINQDKEVQNSILKNYTDKALHGRKVKNDKIVEAFLLERSIGDRWEEFICKKLDDWDIEKNQPSKKKIDFDKRKIFWQNLTDEDINFLSTLILQFLLRKNPSPARLRRIWETTEEFFKDIKENICQYANIPEERCKRYYWENIDIKDGEYRDKDVVFWADDKNVYLISYVCNLQEKEEFKIKTSSNKDIILKIQSAKAINYLPCMSILDPTPISWQFIIPAEYVPNLIDSVMKKYEEYFKFVYGKLPLHIGVIVQDYKQPLYVGIKALRKIRRDIDDCGKLEVKIEGRVIKEKINANLRQEEKDNTTTAHYSLYWGDFNNLGYNFFIKPDDHYKKWIDSIDNIDDNTKIIVMPNTFDFEFLDKTTRRNEIYYDRNNKWKRKIPLKNSRPYDLETWEKFKKFRELFGKENKTKIARSTRLQKLISVIYSKLEDLENYKLPAHDKADIDVDNESINIFLSASFINILKLKEDRELAEGIKELFEIKNEENENLFSLLKERMTLENLQLFIDMYNFWHKALEEV
ncbi:CRISPR-associated protein, Csx11 family [Caldicellulosiruptor hydrothermalis 108]|uniref:CRISPR-associated protein, Csx11 family n=1 Tax=Caldicellulosiruptor hydrothermalis (strain DSM 18901 / VKM B-2411 / 108) TaxID=632292 RepID=E4QAG3_CALH1|nr:CRISPR-associated protein Csx11 [Caldicellulosiruptor hydrothermalis]ADQ08267.1 CRISPR-associated protein, Csx11 family [Caldicellulosiruptor hydrothermalis 108]